MNELLAKKRQTIKMFGSGLRGCSKKSAAGQATSTRRRDVGRDEVMEAPAGFTKTQKHSPEERLQEDRRASNCSPKTVRAQKHSHNSAARATKPIIK